MAGDSLRARRGSGQQCGGQGEADERTLTHDVVSFGGVATGVPAGAPFGARPIGRFRPKRSQEVRHVRWLHQNQRRIGVLSARGAEVRYLYYSRVARRQSP